MKRDGDQVFQRSFGPTYLTEEYQLGYLAGYIFTAATTEKYENPHELVRIAATTLQRTIDSGIGRITKSFLVKFLDLSIPAPEKSVLEV